jgi:hypothetical protein
MALKTLVMSFASIINFFKAERIKEGALTPLAGPTGPPPVSKLVPLRPATDKPKDPQQA